MKTYTVQSSVHRAAKAAGLSKDQYDVVEIDGKFGYVVIEKDLEDDLDEGAPVVGGFRRCPSCDTHLSNGHQTHESLVAEGLEGNKTHEYLCLACNHEFGPELPVYEPAEVKAKPKSTKNIGIKVESTVLRPTKLVWEIAEKMVKENPDVRRKDVIACCVEQGVAFHTARTQYQLWSTAHKVSKG